MATLPQRCNVMGNNIITCKRGRDLPARSQQQLKDPLTDRDVCWSSSSAMDERIDYTKNKLSLGFSHLDSESYSAYYYNNAPSTADIRCLRTHYIHAVYIYLT